MRFLDPLGFDDDARPYTLKATNPTALTVASYTYRHDRHLKQPENPAAVRPPLRPIVALEHPPVSRPSLFGVLQFPFRRFGRVSR